MSMYEGACHVCGPVKELSAGIAEVDVFTLDRGTGQGVGRVVDDS